MFKFLCATKIPFNGSVLSYKLENHLATEKKDDDIGESNADTERDHLCHKYPAQVVFEFERVCSCASIQGIVTTRLVRSTLVLFNERTLEHVT